MISNIKRNRMWLLTGVETFSLGAFFVFFPLFTHGPMHRPTPIDHLVDLLDDKPVAIILLAVGVFSIIVSLWNLHRFYARKIMIGALQLVWTLFAMAFVYSDISNDVFGFVPLLAIAVMVRIFLEAKWGESS